MQLSTWALACLLRLWSADAASTVEGHISSSPEGPVPAVIDSMAPLYPSMRRLGGSLTSGKAASAAAGCVEGYAHLLSGALQSGFRWATPQGIQLSRCLLTCGCSGMPGLHTRLDLCVPFITSERAS
jgi:hypothetical protein